MGLSQCPSLSFSLSLLVLFLSLSLPIQVLMEKFPSWMLAGEVCQVPISFINCGWKGLQSVYLATSLPEYFTVIRGEVGVGGRGEV